MSYCRVHWHGEGPYFREGERAFWCQSLAVSDGICARHAQHAEEGCRCESFALSVTPP